MASSAHVKNSISIDSCLTSMISSTNKCGCSDQSVEINRGNLGQKAQLGSSPLHPVDSAIDSDTDILRTKAFNRLVVPSETPISHRHKKKDEHNFNIDRNRREKRFFPAHILSFVIVASFGSYITWSKDRALLTNVITSCYALSFSTHLLRSRNIKNRCRLIAGGCNPFAIREKPVFFRQFSATKPSTSTAKETIQEVSPMTSTSKEQRKSAERAWNKARSSSQNSMPKSQDYSTVSSTFLEILEAATSDADMNIEETFNTKKPSRTRPKGRPDSVPGAMSRQTILSINDVEKVSSNSNISDFSTATSANASNIAGVSPKWRNSNDTSGKPRQKTDDENSKRLDHKVQHRNYPNAGDGSTTSASNKSSNISPSKQTPKIVTKSSAKRKLDDLDSETTGMMSSSKSSFNSNSKYDKEPPNLQKYYRTELLCAQEEYELGIKIQFMTKCENVHEGLYLRLGRIPTIAEWAYACGFKESDYMCDSNYEESNLDRQIRPNNSEAAEESRDPNMFVGNGLLHASGPGRGKGRVKKVPPVELKPFYDDSPLKFQCSEGKFRKKNDLKPMNSGTPSDFVESMLTGKEAKQRMVQCNMRLVVSIAKRYKYVGVNIADLVQEGSIGLTRAAEKFDPKKGFKFSTYASWWIQQAVFRSIAYHSRTIRLPVHVHNLLNRIRRVRLQLQQALGRSPTNEEVAFELDLTVEKYNKMLRLTRRAISLEMPKYQNNPKDIGQESETSLGDTIDASNVLKDESTPEQSVDQNLFQDDLKDMLKILGEDERRVISARYGLNDGLTRTVTAVASQMGQTKSWVRSQECRALRKLRRPWYEKKLWEHQNSLTG